MLGYQFIPPELRENAGELEAARRGELPELVEQGDLRGDLHAHTTWSADGKSTIEEMALAAKARGYCVPRDHRPLALPARRAGWRRRREEIDGAERAAGAVPAAARASR